MPVEQRIRPGDVLAKATAAQRDVHASVATAGREVASAQAAPDAASTADTPRPGNGR